METDILLVFALRFERRVVVAQKNVASSVDQCRLRSCSPVHLVNFATAGLRCGGLDRFQKVLVNRASRRQPYRYHSVLVGFRLWEMPRGFADTNQL